MSTLQYSLYSVHVHIICMHIAAIEVLSSIQERF